MQKKKKGTLAEDLLKPRGSVHILMHRASKLLPPIVVGLAHKSKETIVELQQVFNITTHCSPIDTNHTSPPLYPFTTIISPHRVVQHGESCS